LGLTGISQAGWLVPLAAEKNPQADFMVLWSAAVCKVSEEDICSKCTNDLDGRKVSSDQEALRSRKTKYIWPDVLGKDTDPSESLAHIGVPRFWIFGGNDGSIPVDLSVRRLKALIARGGQYEFVLIPGQGRNTMRATLPFAIDWIKTLPKSPKAESAKPSVRSRPRRRARAAPTGHSSNFPAAIKSTTPNA
jgi:uncharacterized protein